MDRVQTNKVSEWYMFILLIQPQSNSLSSDGVIYLDICFVCVCVFLTIDKPEWKQAKLK